MATISAGTDSYDFSHSLFLCIECFVTQKGYGIESNFVWMHIKKNSSVLSMAKIAAIESSIARQKSGRSK